MAVPDERRDSLWWPLAPIAVWTAHFGSSYGLIAIGCPRVSSGWVSVGFAVATVLALVPLGLLASRGWRRYQRVAGEAPDQGTPEARHRFLSLLTLLLAALGASGVVYDVVGIALVGGCP